VLTAGLPCGLSAPAPALARRALVQPRATTEASGAAAVRCGAVRCGALMQGPPEPCGIPPTRRPSPAHPGAPGPPPARVPCLSATSAQSRGGTRSQPVLADGV
jgi:hypothetical protein